MSMNPTAVYTRSTGILGDIFTLAAVGGALLAGVEIYYLARHKVDFLLGTAGIQTIAADRFELAAFWVIVLLFCLALATGRFLKTAAGILAVYVLFSLNGVAYRLTGTPTIDPRTMPAISAGTAIKGYDHPDSVLKADTNAGSYYTNNTAAEMAAFAAEKGYTLDKVLSGDKSDPKTPLGWCYATNPKTGKPNSGNSEHSIINCTTGYRYAPPTAAANAS